MGHGMGYRVGLGLLLSILITSLASADPTTKPSKTKPTTHPASKPADDTIVYVSKSGKKYHEADCSLLHGSKISMKLSEAIANGYTPCSKCEAAHIKPAKQPPAPAPAPTPKASNDDPTYRGKALSEWVKLTHDKDQETRDGAFDALKKMLPDPKAKEAIIASLQTEDILNIAQHTFAVAPTRTIHKLAARIKEQIGRKNSGLVAAHASVILIDQKEEYRDMLQDLARQGLDAADSKDADGWRLLVDTIEKNHVGAATADSSK